MKTTLSTLALCITFGLTGDAGATLCFESPPAVTFEHSAAVFAGVPLGWSIDRSVNRDFQHGMLKYSFAVTHIWKGDVQDTLYIVTRGPRDQGGYEFERDEHYIVYAYESRGHLMVGECSRSSKVREALWDRYWLPEATVVRSGVEISRITLEDIFTAFASEDERLRSKAATALWGIEERRSEIVARLSDVIRGKEQGDRWRAAFALRMIGPDAESAVPDLAWALENGDKSLREVAIRAIVQILGIRSLDYIVIALSDSSAPVREFAYGRAAHLAHVMDERFREEEVKRLSESDAYGDPRLRSAVVEILRLLREPDVRNRR